MGWSTTGDDEATPAESGVAPHDPQSDQSDAWDGPPRSLSIPLESHRGRPSIIDVAKRAGVSTGTVSNVLNNPALVSVDKRARVRDAVEVLGFTRNKLASALVRGRSRTVGLATIDLGSSLFVDIARGAQRRAHRAGLYLQLGFADNDPALLDTHIDALTDERVAGLLVAPMMDHGLSIERSRRAGCPVVELNYESTQPSCRVLADYDQAGYLAARHLIELGRTHIALVLALTHLQSVSRRRAGVRRAVAETAGAVTLTEIFVEGVEPEDGVQAAVELAMRPVALRPDAVLAVTDVLAMAIVTELTAAGVDVPTEVAVMGSDYDSATWGSGVPLTSVEMRGEEIGSTGLELLVAEITERPESHVHRTVILEPRLHIRESTARRSSRRS